MIAALFVVALVASAQAYPGQDPIEEALSSNQLRANPTICLMSKIPEIAKAVGEAKKDLPLLEEIIPLLKSNLAKCSQSQPDDSDESGESVYSDKFECYLQAVRDTWEGSAATREALQAGAQKIIAAVMDVATCFKDDKVHFN